MEKHDNLTTTEINTYMNSFQAIINTFLNHTPINMTMRIWRDADLYGRDEYFKALEEGVEKAKLQYEALPVERQQQFQKLGSLNIKWKGKEDWSNLSEDEKEQKIVKGIYYELAATNVLNRIQFTAKGEDKVCLFTKAAPLFIGIGSTKNSIVKHWTGVGVLEKKLDSYEERILSPSQYDSVQKIPHRTLPISLIPLLNLKEILVFDESLNFRKPI